MANEKPIMNPPIPREDKPTATVNSDLVGYITGLFEQTQRHIDVRLDEMRDESRRRGEETKGALERLAKTDHTLFEQVTGLESKIGETNKNVAELASQVKSLQDRERTRDEAVGQARRQLDEFRDWSTKTTEAQIAHGRKVEGALSVVLANDKTQDQKLDASAAKIDALVAAKGDEAKAVTQLSSTLAKFTAEVDVKKLARMAVIGSFVGGFVIAAIVAAVKAILARFGVHL